MQGFLSFEEGHQDTRDADKTSLHKNSKDGKEAEDIDKEMPDSLRRKSVYRKKLLH